ncbi:MAG: hypothetical protein OXH40_05990 [Chloroflexi bacterium]|nr:hypothetical protein [Chloroflexota bacterium]MCY3687073.1 hypothetical protein [Chloroflexota bacterium]MDE2708622.1 hypothetical protein [Chloroflexota bacterium]
MSRRGREGTPSDDVLLQALDRLVASEGIVEAGDRLGVNYRTAAKCLDERHVSRRMRQALEKHVREQTEREEQASSSVLDGAAPDEPQGGEDARLQETGEDWRRAVDELRVELASLLERMEAVEGHVSRGPDHGDGGVSVDDVDAGQGVEHRRSVVAPRRVFAELITEDLEPGEEQVYGAAAEEVVEWREAWADRKQARYTLDWLRAEMRRLELELRLIGVFGLTPPPADVPWGERRRERELEWRRLALRRLRWQLPATWCLHRLLRALTLGLWGRQKGA